MTAMTGERKVLGARFRRWPQALAAVALGLMWLLPSGADAAILKRVHSGITAQPTAGTTVALELPDASKAFVVCSNNASSGNAQNRQDCILSDNLITFDAGANISPPFNVSWYVAEFESGVSVQRGTARFVPGSTTPTTAPTITAVDCSKSFVILPGESRSNAWPAIGATDEAEIFRAVLGTFASPCGVTPGTTTTTLSIERGSTASAMCGTCDVYVSWQVVTMDGATVLARATTSLLSATGATTVTPSPAMAADQTKAFLLMSRAAGSAVAGAEAEYQVRGDLANCTGSPVACSQVTFNRVSIATTAGHQADIAYEVVRLDDGGWVQRGNTSVAANVLTMTSIGLSAIDRSAAVPFFSASGGNSTTATYLDETSWTVEFPVANGTPTPAPTQLQFTRKSSNNNTVTANWFVVSFYKCQNSRLCSMSAKDGGSGSVTVSWSPLYDGGPGLFGPTCVINTNTPHACDAIVVRDTAAITWTPFNSTSYTVGTQPTGGPASMRTVFNGSGQSFTDSGLLTNGTQYFYRVYPKQPGALVYTTDSAMTQTANPINQVSVTPSANANLAWNYPTTGGSTLNAPIAGSGKVYVASNGNKVIALNSSTGAELATPVSTNGAVQSYLAWFPVSAGGGAEAVIAVDDKGWLTRVNALTGARQWTIQLPVDNIGSTNATQGSIYATVSAQLGAYATCDGNAFVGAYGATTDLIYVASRNTSQTANQIWAVRADTGAIQWTYPPTAGTPAMDRATGQPYVDYCRNRLWVSTGNGSGGTQDSLWVINTLNGAKITSFPGTGVNSVGNQTNSAPTLSYSGTTVYVGDAAGKVYAFDAATIGTTAKYSLQLGGTSPTITGFIWEDWTTPGQLYIPVVTNGSAGVWCVQDSGSALGACPGWTTNPRSPVASGTLAQPLVTGTAIFFPASDGKIYQINTTDGQLYQTTGRPFTVEGVALGGLSTEDWTQLYVGTSSGRSYRINLTGGNLP